MVLSPLVYTLQNLTLQSLDFWILKIKHLLITGIACYM